MSAYDDALKAQQLQQQQAFEKKAIDARVIDIKPKKTNWRELAKQALARGRGDAGR